MLVFLLLLELNADLSWWGTDTLAPDEQVNVLANADVVDLGGLGRNSSDLADATWGSLLESDTLSLLGQNNGLDVLHFNVGTFIFLINMRLTYTLVHYANDTMYFAVIRILERAILHQRLRIPKIPSGVRRVQPNAMRRAYLGNVQMLVQIPFQVQLLRAKLLQRHYDN